MKVTEKALLAVVVLATGGLVAACGSSSTASTSTAAASVTTTSPTTGTNGQNSGRRAALVACLKQHGVTLPARPPGAGGGGSGAPGVGGSGGGGRGFLFGGGGAGANPKLRAALQACGARFGFRGRGFRRPSQQTIQRYVTCVRQHGYNLPNPNLSGKGPVFPASIRTDPKFQSASKPCQSILAPPAPSGGTTTNPGA